MLKFGWFHHSCTQDFNGTINCDPSFASSSLACEAECNLRMRYREANQVLLQPMVIAVLSTPED